MEPIFLKPVLQPKIWGGQKLMTVYGMKADTSTDSNAIGEAWCISAHPNGISQIISPELYKGQGLDTLYQEHPELFGKQKTDKFPLLTKILDAKDVLSVQVHPDDAYALEHEGELGKTECWYVMNAEADSTIVYGHRAQSPEEFLDKVENGRWKELLVEVPVKAGDFFYVPHGTIHAIGKGVVILETQQNSDTTYRVYDYDRIDDNGNRRDLHIQQSIDVTTFPDKREPITPIVTTYNNGSMQTVYLDNEFFKVSKWQVIGSMQTVLEADYTLATVIEGHGQLIIADKTYDLPLACSFILPYGIKDIVLTGDFTLMVSSTPQ